MFVRKVFVKEHFYFEVPNSLQIDDAQLFTDDEDNGGSICSDFEYSDKLVEKSSNKDVSFCSQEKVLKTFCFNDVFEFKRRPEDDDSSIKMDDRDNIAKRSPEIVFVHIDHRFSMNLLILLVHILAVMIHHSLKITS